MTKYVNEAVEVGKFRMFLNPADTVAGGVSDELWKYRIWEPIQTQITLQEVLPGNIALDIGANIGYYTLLLASAVRDSGKVFAFEPEPTNYCLLEKNIRLNRFQNVTAICKAASDQAGSVSLYLSEENKGDHRLFGSSDNRQSVVVDSLKLDESFGETLGPVDFVKMDVQGAECRALTGMFNLLERSPNIRMITEFWPRGMVQCGSSPSEYLRMLSDLGFSLYRISEKDGTVTEMNAEALLAAYTVENDQFTNLFCARGQWQGLARDDTWAFQTAAERQEAIGRAWQDVVDFGTADILQVVPQTSSFVLVDDNRWATAGFLNGRKIIPFLERHGEYWGLPSDDAVAIRELERLRAGGASFVVFAWPALWWLEHYAQFHEYLSSHFRCVLANDRVVVYDMRRTEDKSPRNHGGIDNQ